MFAARAINPFHVFVWRGTNFAFAPSGLDTVRVSNAVQGLGDEAEYSKKFLTGVKICASIANNLSVSQSYKRESSKT